MKNPNGEKPPFRLRQLVRLTPGVRGGFDLDATFRVLEVSWQPRYFVGGWAVRARQSGRRPTCCKTCDREFRRNTGYLPASWFVKAEKEPADAPTP